MSYSAAELAASGDAVRAFHALLRSARIDFTVIDLGPASRARGGLWRIVLSGSRLSARAHGLCDGTLALALSCEDLESALDCVREIAPAALGVGEVRVGGLRPVQAKAIVEHVLAHLRSRCTVVA